MARSEVEHLTEEDQQSLVKYITNSLDYFNTQGFSLRLEKWEGIFQSGKVREFEQPGKVREFETNVIFIFSDI